MEEQFITYQTALLAKEKGFDLDSNYFREQEEGKPDYDDSCENWNLYDGYCTIVTQSILQKWIREKKHRNIRIGSTSLTCHFPYVEKIYEDGTQMVNISFKGNYKSYEDALEFGLQEALKTIL